MEFLNWKNILLEWANRLDYLGCPYYSLNLAEVERFFNEYKRNITSVDIASTKLDSFFKQYYPQFQPTYNKEGKICPEDYIYGYSLLMFFSCVTHPEHKMQKILQTMQDETQLIVKTFLQNMLECNSFSRDAIKSVIETSAPAKISDYVLVLSPNKANEIDVCPPTPRTKILNEWNSENRQLKALVETERYEKGFLEIQLKQKEEQINELTQERRKFLTDIQDLKSKLSAQDMENVPPNENSQTESLKRRLRKELSEKDREIKELQNKLNDHLNSNENLAEKLAYVQSQYNKSIDSSNDMAVKLDEITEKSEKQMQHIKGLEITIKEYQKYFNESSSKGNSLDTSLDNLDDSYAMHMANISNKSMSSPENLGKVVDIQLREQILLYENLLDKCNQIEQEKGKLNDQLEEQIQKLTEWENKCGKLEAENSSNVKRYEDKLVEIAALSHESESNLNKFQSLRVEFDSLMVKVKESQEKAEDLDRAKSLLQGQLSDRELEIAVLNQNRKTISEENASHLLQIECIKAREENLQFELEGKIELINRLQSKIAQLEEEIKASLQRQNNLQCEVERLNQLVNDLLSQIDRLKASAQVSSEEYAVAINEKSLEIQKIEAERDARTVQLEDQLKLVSELNLNLDAANAQIIVAESVRVNLKSQYEEIHRQKDQMVYEMETERTNLTNQVNNLQASLTDVQRINTELQTQNAELVAAMKKTKKELSEEVCHLTNNLMKVEASLTAAETQHSELSDANAALTQRIAEQEVRISELVQEHQEVCDSLNEKVASLIAAESLNSELSTANVTSTQRIADQEVRITELVQSLTAAESQHSELSATKAALTQRIADQEIRISELVQEHQEVCDSWNEKFASLIAAESLNSELSTANVTSTQQIADQEVRITELVQSLTAAESQHSELSATNAALTQRIADQEIRISELVQEHQNVCDSLNEKVASLIAAESLNSELSTANVTSTQQIADQEVRISELIQSLTAAESQHSELSVANAALTHLIAEKEVRISELVQEHQDVCDSLNEKVASLTAAESLHSELSTADVTSRQRIADQELRITELVQSLTATESQRSELSTADVTSRQRIADQEIRISELVQSLTAAESQHSELSATNAALTQRIAEQEIRISELLQEHQNVCDSLNDKVARVTNQVESLEVMRIDLETQLNQSEEEKEKLFLNLQEKTDEAEATESNLKEVKQQYKVESAKYEELMQKNKSNSDVFEKTINQLQMENQIFKNSAEQELIQKNLQVAELSKAIEDLESELATIRVDKSTVETELQRNVALVNELRDDLKQKKLDLAEKSKSIDTLSGQIDQLKTAETSMVANTNALSEKYEALVHKLKVSESSRDTLSLKCTSLNENLMASEIKCNDLEKKFTDQSLVESARDVELKSLESEVITMKQKLAEMAETAYQEQTVLKTKLELNEKEIAAISAKADETEVQRVAEIEQFKRTIEGLHVQNRSLTTANEQLTEQLSRNKVEVESYQQSVNYKAEIEELIKTKEILNLRVNDLTSETEKLRKDLEKAKQENVSLTDENIDLATEIEKVRREYTASDESNKDEINSLKLENNRLIATNSENLQRIEELHKSNGAKSSDCSAKLEADLKVALTDLESKMQECLQAQEIHRQLVNDNKILSAKLTKHREISALQEEDWQKERAELVERCDKACTEIRFELDGKLIKMKERMKHIYTEETSKAKEKYDKQEREVLHYKNQSQMLTEKIEKYDEHVGSIRRQLYKLNEQNLEVKKENEFLKNKLRLAESKPRESRLFPPPCFGSNIKMEDEDGEVFNNTYLSELKSGIPRLSPTGRDSIRQSELQQRNSMAARHLRSTYAAQYGDQNLREEDISMPYLNDSMFSNQLDVRRGTLYQRPGPPTPSKNGGRLSFGGSNVTASDLFPKEVLREQNNNAKTKTTPGKLMSMFSSSKHKEADRRKSITRPIYSTFTSTPRQKSTWAREHRSILAIKANSSQSTESDDDAASVSPSTASLLSVTNNKRKSITRRFSIISKCRQDSAMSSVICKKRREYREKNHSMRLKGFEACRELFLQMNDDVVDDRFQLIFNEQQNELFPLDLAPFERFEILTKHTQSEHPYSNEPTTIEAIEANDSSLLSSSPCQSKTMSNIIIYGKIPRIQVNETPQRELIRSKTRTGSIWFTLMDLTKQIILVFILIVLYASYIMSNFLIRKND